MVQTCMYNIMYLHFLILNIWGATDGPFELKNTIKKHQWKSTKAFSARQPTTQFPRSVEPFLVVKSVVDFGWNMVEPCEIGRSYHSQLGQHTISTPLRTTVSASFVSFDFFATFSVQFTFQRDYPIIHAFTPCWSLWCRQGAPLLLLKPSGFAPLCGHPHQRSELLRHQRWSSLEGRMWLSALPSKRTFRVIAYHAYWKFTNFEEGNTWTAMIASLMRLQFHCSIWITKFQSARDSFD